jgi:hypothetical protein
VGDANGVEVRPCNAVGDGIAVGLGRGDTADGVGLGAGGDAVFEGLPVGLGGADGLGCAIDAGHGRMSR